MRFQKAEEADWATLAKRLYAALEGLPPESWAAKARTGRNPAPERSRFGGS